MCAILYSPMLGGDAYPATQGQPPTLLLPTTCPHVTAPQVSLPEGELGRVDALPAQWERFVVALEGVPARLRALCA